MATGLIVGEYDPQETIPFRSTNLSEPRVVFAEFNDRHLTLLNVALRAERCETQNTTALVVRHPREFALPCKPFLYHGARNHRAIGTAWKRHRCALVDARQAKHDHRLVARLIARPCSAPSSRATRVARTRSLRVDECVMSPISDVATAVQFQPRGGALPRVLHATPLATIPRANRSLPVPLKTHTVTTQQVPSRQRCPTFFACFAGFFVQFPPHRERSQRPRRSPIRRSRNLAMP